jgi:hypothetical protein
MKPRASIHILRFVAAFVTVGLLAVGVSAFLSRGVSGSNASQDASRAPAGPPRPQGASLPQLTGVPRELLRSFPVLRRAWHPADLVPKHALDPLMAEQQGATSRLSRRAGATPFGERLWLVPARTGICVVSSDHVVNVCGQGLSATDDTAGVETVVCAPGLPANDVEIAGVLSANRSPVLILANGRELPIQTMNGAFAVRLARKGPRALAVRWHSRTGTQSAKAGEPPGSARASCSGTSAAS